LTHSSYRAHTSPLFKQLGLMKSKDIFTDEIAKKMYSYNKNPEINSNKPILELNESHQHNTRLAARNNYFIPRKKAESGKNAFYIGSKIW